MFWCNYIGTGGITTIRCEHGVPGNDENDDSSLTTIVRQAGFARKDQALLYTK